MDSKLAKELRGNYHPVAFLRTNTKPETAMQPKSGARGGCVMSYFAQAALNGKTAVFDKDTILCAGAVSGFCFGRAYETWLPGGMETYAAFFSGGLSSAKDPVMYQKFVENLPKGSQAAFLEGERLHSSYKVAENFVKETMPNYPLPETYAVLKPLSDLEADEVPISVTFTVNPVGVSALTHLIAALPGAYDTITTARHSGCQSIGSVVLQESESDSPRAVLGFLDLAARKYVRRLIPDEYLTFSVPWKMFLEMEDAVSESVLTTHLWKSFQE